MFYSPLGDSSTQPGLIPAFALKIIPEIAKKVIIRLNPRIPINLSESHKAINSLQNSFSTSDEKLYSSYVNSEILMKVDFYLR